MPRLSDLKRPLLALLLSLPAATAAVAADAVPVQLVDRIVAVVNTDVITRFELDARIRIVVAQMERQRIPRPAQEVLERQVLERLISDRIQLQTARDTGIRIDDAQLNKTLERIAQENNLSIDGFRATLEKEGVPFARFREELREEIMLVRLRERDVDNRVAVSENEVENFLSARGAQESEAEFNLAHILIQVKEQASPEEIQSRHARAEQALRELKGGAEFRSVAANYSDAPDALENGGQLGWRKAARLPALFMDPLKTMKPGELSDILKSPNGFHILRLVEKRSGGQPFFVQQTRARHILIKTTELTSEADIRQRLTQIRERIEHGADFAEMARLHSEDGSAPRGGDLGWINPGDTVPEFEQALAALKDNQVSAPVKSPFGWHLIKAEERRQQDVSQERQKMQARLEIRARKAEESFQDWVRQLRDSAFVEIRLEDR